MKTIPFGDLPSRGVRFKNKEKYPHLTINRLSLKEMGLLSSAVTNNNPDSFLEAIKSLINVPISYLSIGDFYYVVTYLRCNMSTPLSLSWACDGFWYHEKESDELIKAPDARALMTNPETRDKKLVPESCGHENTETFPFEDMIVVYLPEEMDLGENCEVPSAALIPEFERLTKDPKMAQIVPVVQWIKHGNSLRDKMLWLESQGDRDMDLFDEASAINQKYSHGISNLLIGECTKCGTKVKQKFNLTAESFFRSI